jgi:hypothetical protein
LICGWSAPPDEVKALFEAAMKIAQLQVKELQ